ncbi:hypothetical protein K450DRAFT_219980 [Umbelopsis ramanniana AG]|uniref:Dicer-like protein 1 n=1 Tax=Umbelopsis ramanniana AG TaxID=1314678 RepID=A0AAD5HGQ1_UMBRA|nr:uncharacterized protein K450DRAFT_219980 [Umbelopsis ramanniana AG]KAI8583787.1 hypothetical protein K450DRAFT_219980 [Umbelopsis ramanniana AG]
MTVPRHGSSSSNGISPKKFGTELTSSPFSAYTNPNAPIITVVKNSGVFLDSEYDNAIPGSLAMPMEFIIDGEVLDVPENTSEEEPKDAPQLKALDPREYQLELLEKAKKENIIAVLDTGSGKTLIAVMLIKEMEVTEKIERETRKKTKFTVFLVSRVPLVFQQKEVIAINSDLRVNYLCGELVWDQWNKKMWDNMINEDDVCVMTAQIFLDALRHGFIHMDRINLMVFDECHHATKSHTFNLIMREFYHRCPQQDRPKIFGMTASPMNSRGRAEESLYTLEKNLDAKIFTSQNLTSLQAFVYKPTEIIVEYTPYSVYESKGLYKLLLERFYDQPSLKNLITAARWTYHQLGSWCCDALCQKWFDTFSTGASDDDMNNSEDELLQLNVDNWVAAKEACQSYSIPQPNLEDPSMFSNKIQRLIQILKIFSSSKVPLCGIIFVERRYTAYVLMWLIRSCAELSNIKSAVLAGHQANGVSEAKMGYKNQNRVISKFRNGEVNLLIATNVAEEGLDIQPCNLVLRFDTFHTLISYVQSRGRARHKDSKYIILMEKGDVAAERLLYELRQSENVVRDWCNALPADRKASVNAMDDDPFDLYCGDEDDEYDDDVDDFFLVPSTQAAITLNSAVPLIHHYCSTLPKDEYCDLKPEFSCVKELDTFICTLKLPSNAVVQETFTEAARSKTLAKKLVAMKAAIALYHAKGLSDHLMPIVVKPEMLGDMAPQMDRKGNIIGSRKRRKVYKKKTWLSMDDTGVPIAIRANETHSSGDNNAAEALGQLTPGEQNISILADAMENDDTDANLVAEERSQDPSDEMMDVDDTNHDHLTLYLTHIKHNLNDDLDAGIQYRDICLLTYKEFPVIPAFHLYLQNKTTETIVRTVSIGQGYTFDLEEADMLRKYTIQIFSAISNKSYECDLEDMPYFLVPLKFDIHDEIDRDSFDWTEIGRVVENLTPKLDIENLDQYTDRVVVDHSDSLRRYIFHQARRDMTPASEIPSGYHGREDGYKNFADYYEQVLSRTPGNMDQPMMEVRRFTKVLNYLSPIANVEAKAPKRSAQYLIPEFCELYPISTSMYRTAMLMPSIMMHIDAVLLVKEVNEKLETNIDDTLLLEAFTTPSANMDTNYERLETLGDSFLKFVATIRLYIMFPHSHEGQLHCQRIRIICNKALYRGARRLQLYKHISSQPLNRRRWRPPHFKLSTDNEEDLRMKLRRHSLSDKTLADIVEATMGAAYLAGGVELGLKAAIALQIPFDHITEWKHFNETYTESRAQLKARVKETSKRHLKLDHLEEITGYRFRNPLLVVEALTHASAPNSTVPCYQRLEFLGDGILDFLVVNYLFRKYPDYEPGRMTDIKDGCVNNRVLGTMCLEIGLNKHIIHFSSKLMGAITQFAREVELIKDSGEDVGEYWSDLDVPKVLSDVVESVLGAIFVDSGFDFDTVQKSFNFFMLPFFDKYVQPDILKVHPLKTLTTGLQKIHCDGLLLR